MAWQQSPPRLPPLIKRQRASSSAPPCHSALLTSYSSSQFFRLQKKKIRNKEQEQGSTQPALANKQLRGNIWGGIFERDMARDFRRSERRFSLPVYLTKKAQSKAPPSS